MVVKALSRQHLGQVAFAPGGLFQLGALVLEPDLDLRLVQTQVVGQLLSSVLVQVPVVLKLFPQLGQLLGREGCPRPLLVRRG